MRITIGLSSACLLALAPAARADRRSFVRSYEYATQPQGNLEAELWNDVIRDSASSWDAAATEHRFELEYGLTDHWDVALYHVFTQSPGTSFRFDAWRLETRYRLVEKGEWPVDVLLYFEVERPAAFNQPFETEEKLILEKDFGRFALVTNIVGEQKFLHAGDKHLWEIDVGARYELSPVLRLAAEAWTIQETTGPRPLTKSTYFAGPSLSVATGKFWLQIGAGFGLPLGDTESAAFIRSVLGFNL
jgi:hypothetical protein